MLIDLAAPINLALLIRRTSARGREMRTGLKAKLPALVIAGLIYLPVDARMRAFGRDFKDWLSAIEPTQTQGLEQAWRGTSWAEAARPFRLSIIQSEIEKLIASGSSPNDRDGNNNTPLMLSIASTGDAVPILLDKGADVNAANSAGTTPLLLAIRTAQFGQAGSFEKNHQIARLLIDRGANVNANNNKGETPLIMAAINCDDELVRFLLEKGANAKARDASGRTAERRARDIKCARVLAALKSFHK